MAGLSGSKKVSRAARTGGSSRRKGESPLGFYALLALLAILGIATVAFSRDERLDLTTPNDVAPLEPVNNTTDPSQNRAGDRWYQAYGIYICDKFVPVINSDRDPYGLSTKNDGIIYIHPYTKADAGRNATLGHFADGVQLNLSNDSINVPGDENTYETGQTKCGDVNGELVVKEWADPTKPDESIIVRGDSVRDVRLKNNAALTLAFVPEGKEDIPLPESATNGALAGAAAKEQAEAATPAATPTPDPAAVDPAAAVPATEVPVTVPSDATPTTAVGGQ